MKQLLLCLLFCFALSSCEQETAPPFSKEKIQSILIQIHLTDASISTLLGAHKDSMSIVAMEQVKTINNISDEDIESIFTYLKSDPDFAEEIYGSMIAEVNKMQQDKKEKDKKDKKGKVGK